MDFEELVESFRKLRENLSKMPNAEKDKPTIELEKNIKALLEEYDKLWHVSKSEYE